MGEAEIFEKPTNADEQEPNIKIEVETLDDKTEIEIPKLDQQEDEIAPPKKKRGRKPVSEERRKVLAEQLKKGRAKGLETRRKKKAIKDAIKQKEINENEEILLASLEKKRAERNNNNNKKDKDYEDEIAKLKNEIDLMKKPKLETIKEETAQRDEPTKPIKEKKKVSIKVEPVEERQEPQRNEQSVNHQQHHQLSSRQILKMMKRRR